MSNIDTYGARAYDFGHHGLRRVWSAVLRAARKGDVGRYPIIDDGEARGVTVAGSSGRSEGAESRWAVILEATTDFVGMADVHGGVLYVNRAGREMVGAGEDEDLSGTTIAAYHPRWASEVVLGEGIPTALREGSWSGETALLSSEGEEIPVSQVILAHRDPGGKIRFLSTTARDIADRKRAEDELARSRRLFASIAEATPDLLYVSELAGGRNVYANRQAERILGYDQEQLMAFGGSINDKIVHPEDKARALAAWAGLASLGDGEVQEHEFRARHSDGRYRWLRARNVILSRMEDGRPLRVLGVAQDVTERKRDEEERERLLEESERRAAELDAVIRGIPDAVYVGDEAGIRVCNDAALRMLGFESVEEMDRSIPLLSERLENRFAATGRRIPPEEEPFARALKGETVVEEVVARHLKTGRDVIMRCAAAPIVREGEIVGAVAVNSDVTEQKKAQERLAYHAHLLENTDDAIIATDERFIVKAWNRGAVEMYGWTVDEAVDRPVHEVIAPDLTDEQRDETLRELADSGRSRNEIVTHRKDGTSVYIEGITVALREEQGHVTGYLSINRDVGERKRVEEALLEIREGERRRIARDLHDVVLQDLAAALQAVQATRIRSAEPHEELGQAADILRSTARSLRGVIHDLRLEEGQQFVKAVEALAAGLGHRLAPESEVDIGVESGFPQKLPGDLGVGLLRIIREALANALRHSGARRIDVALRSREGWVAIEVTDDGRGFDLDAIEGSSFGLWAMEERARALGAKLEVRSAPGGGTKVSVEASAGPRGDQG